MLTRNEHPDERVTYDLLATLDPRAVDLLAIRGIPLEPETEHDAPGRTAFAYVTSDDDEFLLIYHPEAPVPGIEVLARVADRDALERLVSNLGGDPTLVSWRSDPMV